MGSNGSNDVSMYTADETEDFVEIKIRTLDSQTYSLRVNKSVSVPALKEQIATVTGVLSEQQRLICRGKVLRDDQLLSAYHVEDGHTLHLVSRQPVPASSTPSAPNMGSEDATDTSASNRVQNHGNSISHSFVIEAVNIDQGDHSSPTLGRLVSGLLNSIATASAATGNARVDPREMGTERPDRAYSNVSHSDASHPHPSTAAPRVEYDPQQAAFRFPSTFNLGFQHPLVIYDSLTTIHQYLSHMRDEFRREAFEDIGGELIDNLESFGTHVNGGENHTSQPRSVSMHGALPSPAALAEILLSARELLINQAGGRLAQLARQLENQASVTDPSLRANIQSSAVRSGLLLQNLGSSLLELGRTTMTLHMGQTPTEAVVNAGPAVFISALGPNPLMVQPIPFYPGSSFSGLHTETANPLYSFEGQPLDPAHVARNIDMRIHTGHTVPIATANLGEQVDAQQTQEQADSVRYSPRANFIRQAFPGVSGIASLTGEPSMRVVPIRTVVAVPAGVSRSAPDSSGRAEILYPLFARMQQQQSVNASDATGPQSSTDPHSDGSETDQQPILESSMPTSYPGHLPTNPSAALSGMPSATTEPAHYHGPTRIFISRESLPTGNIGSSQSVDGHQIVQGSVSQVLSRFDQWFRNILTGEEGNASENGRQNPAADSTTTHSGTTRNAEAQESARADDQAVFFSNLVRQIMPHISQGTNTVPGTSTAQSEESPAEPSSSRHRRDPPESPSSKRPKRS